MTLLPYCLLTSSIAILLPSATHRTPLARARAAPRATAESVDEDLPRDLRSLAERARVAIRGAALSGVRGMLIDAAVPTLDPAVSDFDPSLLARFAVECARELHSLASLTGSGGRVLVLVPGLSCAVAANQFAGEGEGEAEGGAVGADAVAAADGESRFEIHSLGMAPLPSVSADPPAAVAVVGVPPSGDADDPTVQIARAWLRLVSSLAGERSAGPPSPPPLTLALNLRCGQLVELADFTDVCTLVPFSVLRRGWRGPLGRGEHPEEEQAKVCHSPLHPAPT